MHGVWLSLLAYVFPENNFAFHEKAETVAIVSALIGAKSGASEDLSSWQELSTVVHL
jgi:hypothetical protein